MPKSENVAQLSFFDPSLPPEDRVYGNSKFKFIDLFAGVGGMRLGFESVGGKCVFSSKWDTSAQKTYEANFGELPAGDITKIETKDIPDFDFLLAGFPCQPFSSIGKREGFKHATQGTLFYDVLRIIEEKRPKAFLLENVQGLTNHDKGNTFKIIERDEYKCVICGLGKAEGLDLQVDHIKAKELGGKAEIANGQTLCAKHNFMKKISSQTETGKKMFIRLLEASKESDEPNKAELVAFCEDILEVFEKHGINGHIEWQK
jgi:C-5 cytosine-specific DNA methylase/HNH endonuclease